MLTIESDHIQADKQMDLMPFKDRNDYKKKSLKSMLGWNTCTVIRGKF